jgi:hypothetical protein
MNFNKCFGGKGMARMNKRFGVFFAAFFLSIWCSHHVLAAPEIKAVLVVKASSESQMETKLLIRNSKLIDQIARTKARNAATYIPVTDTCLTIYKNKAETTYAVDRKGNLYPIGNNEMVELSSAVKEELLKVADALRSAHYGKIVPWEEAKELVPKNKKFKVIDLESGLGFNVQSRAGSRHADVQPLTKADSAVMKQIYNGNWSWQRKAILVKTEDQLLAASMHGMPHGGDGIPDNGFKGHFCIHFLGSTTHKTRNIDPKHQLMVRKAGGTLDEYFAQASPYDIVDTYLTAYNVHDTQLIKMSLTHSNLNPLETLLQTKGQIDGILRGSKFVERDFADLISVELPVEVILNREGHRPQNAKLLFMMKRTSILDPWKIDSIEVVPGPQKRGSK